jgi:hypothetical protein
VEAGHCLPTLALVGSVSKLEVATQLEICLCHRDREPNGASQDGAEQVRHGGAICRNGSAYIWDWGAFFARHCPPARLTSMNDASLLPVQLNVVVQSHMLLGGGYVDVHTG